MSYYKNAMKEIRKSLRVANNFTAISMWVSIFIGFAGIVVWLSDSFTQIAVIDGISLIFAILYIVSLVMVVIGEVLMNIYEKKMEHCKNLYKRAKTNLFYHNISVANEFYYGAMMEGEAV